MVRFADGGEVAARTVVLATGVSYHPGGARRRGAHRPRHLLRVDRDRGPDLRRRGRLRGRGRQPAGQAAVYPSRHARQVTMLVRADGLERSMSHYLIRQIRDTDNIQVRAPIAAWSAPGHRPPGAAAPPRTPATGRLRGGHGLPVRVHRRGPRTEWLGGVVERDRKGFVVTGLDLLAGQPAATGLAAGPRTLLPGGQRARGVRAGHGGQPARVASAVGEGAMAIQLVHRYLEAL